MFLEPSSKLAMTRASLETFTFFGWLELGLARPSAREAFLEPSFTKTAPQPDNKREIPNTPDKRDEIFTEAITTPSGKDWSVKAPVFYSKGSKKSDCFFTVVKP